MHTHLNHISISLTLTLTLASTQNIKYYGWVIKWHMHKSADSSTKCIDSFWTSKIIGKNGNTTTVAAGAVLKSEAISLEIEANMCCTKKKRIQVAYWVFIVNYVVHKYFFLRFNRFFTFQYWQIYRIFVRVSIENEGKFKSDLKYHISTGCYSIRWN